MRRADKFKSVCRYLFETHELLSPTMILNRLVEVHEDFVIREVRYCLKTLRKSEPSFMHIGGWQLQQNRKGNTVHLPEALYKKGVGKDVDVPVEMLNLIQESRAARTKPDQPPKVYPSHNRIPIGTGEFLLQNVWSSVVHDSEQGEPTSNSA